MNITIGNLIDKLSIINIKIYLLEDIKRDNRATESEIACATKKTNIINSERAAIIDSIDLELNEIAEGRKQKLFGANKMYGK